MYFVSVNVELSDRAQITFSQASWECQWLTWNLSQERIPLNGLKSYLSPFKGILRTCPSPTALSSCSRAQDRNALSRVVFRRHSLLPGSFMAWLFLGAVQMENCAVDLEAECLFVAWILIQRLSFLWVVPTCTTSKLGFSIRVFW